MNACSDLDLLLDAHPAVEPELTEAVAEHTASCSRCRERLEAHRALTAAFAGRPVPVLSSDFDARLHERIARERRRLRALLYGYWVAALGAIASLLAWVDLPSEVPEGAQGALVFALLLTLGGLLAPAAALFRSWTRTPGLG